MKTCLVCDTDISNKRADARFCSDSCKLKFNRTQKLDDTLPVRDVKDDVTFDTVKDLADHTFVKGTFENPDQTWDRGCVLCGKVFETPLQLMRFCSEECKKDVMVVIANGPHKNSKV